MDTMEMTLTAERESREKFERETIVQDGLSVMALRVAFEKVQNAENWKNPIRQTLIDTTIEERHAISVAVTFFTGSTAKWTALGHGLWMVVAVGYFDAVGA